MGSELLGDSFPEGDTGVGESEDKPTLSYTEIFYQCLPHYLAMGMSAYEFWNCDPRTYRAYREKDRLEAEKENERLWLQGMYVYQAILLTAPRLNSIKPQDPIPYPDKPFDLNIRDEQEEEDRPMTDEEIQKSSAFVGMIDWAYKVNKGKQNG